MTKNKKLLKKRQKLRNSRELSNHIRLPQIAKKYQPLNIPDTIQYTKDYIQFVCNKPLESKPPTNGLNSLNHAHSHLRNNFEFKKDYDFSFEWFTPDDSEVDDDDNDDNNNENKKEKTIVDLTLYPDESILNFNN